MMQRAQQTQPLFKKIDNYVFRFDDLLGQGNFSKVYKGINQLTNESVAIKVIELNSLKSKKLEELLFSEIDVLKKLNHPNILKCFEVFTSNRNCYIVTEVCNGGDLETKLRKHHYFSELEAEPYILDIFKGLRYLAQNNVIHRDIKVANVFLHNGIAKIADFGFAKFTRDNFKDINIGSPIYMSPEGFIDNIYGPKTDVWAFGILIYELLHGKTPFSHCVDQADLRREIKTPISYASLKSDLSFDIKDVIIKCLQINEQKRPSVLQLQEAPYFQKLLKLDVVLLGGRKNSLNLNNSTSLQVNKALTPSHGNLTPFQNRNGIITLSGSLQKNKSNVKGLTNNFDNIGSGLKFSSEERMPNQNTYSSNKIINTSLNQKINVPNNFMPPFRDGSLQKGSNYVMGMNPDVNIISPSMNSVEVKQRVNSGYMVTKSQQSALPGTLSFKQAVNSLHYCRLIYKFIMLNREIEESDRKFASLLAVLMFKILGEISTKIDHKQISYDAENNKKQMKLREVSNEYYRKYSADIERPFNKEISYAIVIAEVKNKIQDYEQMYANKIRLATYVHCLHFLMVILEATEILNRCSIAMKFWQWSQYREIEDFLGRNKSSMTYQSYLALKQRVLKY